MRTRGASGGGGRAAPALELGEAALDGSHLPLGAEQAALARQGCHPVLQLLQPLLQCPHTHTNHTNIIPPSPLPLPQLYQPLHDPPARPHQNPRRPAAPSRGTGSPRGRSARPLHLPVAGARPTAAYALLCVLVGGCGCIGPQLRYCARLFLERPAVSRQSSPALRSSPPPGRPGPPPLHVRSRLWGIRSHSAGVARRCA